MTWLALVDQSEGRFDPTGLSREKQVAPAFLARGSIMLEADGLRANGVHQFLTHHGKGRGLTISLEANSGLKLCTGAGSVTLPCEAVAKLRLVYSWDLLSAKARISMECQTGQITSDAAPLPAPIQIQTLRSMVNGDNASVGSAVDYLAVSSEVETMGPFPTLLGQTRVMSADGPVPVARLKRGDLVRSMTGELVPVLHRISRALPARGAFAPVRLYAPAFGLQEDLLVCASQCLMARGPDVEYSFGCETVLLPVGHLLGTPFARPASCGSVVTYHQLILPRNEGLMTGRATLASLNIGRLRRNDDNLAHSALKHIDRNLLPEHPSARFRTLQSADAMALLDERVA